MGNRHYADVPIHEYGCRATDEIRHGCHADFEMVIPRHLGADTCNGDSGGPVLEETADGLAIIAVTSRSVTNSAITCGDGGIYTRTDATSRWIDTELERLQ